MNRIHKKLSISSWNVHGLGDKMKDPMFLDFLNKDINILLETWKGCQKILKLKAITLSLKYARKQKKPKDIVEAL